MKKAFKECLLVSLGIYLFIFVSFCFLFFGRCLKVNKGRSVGKQLHTHVCRCVRGYVWRLVCMYTSRICEQTGTFSFLANNRSNKEEILCMYVDMKNFLARTTLLRSSPRQDTFFYFIKQKFWYYSAMDFQTRDDLWFDCSPLRKRTNLYFALRRNLKILINTRNKARKTFN